MLIDSLSVSIVAGSDGFQLKDFQLIRYKAFFSHQQVNSFLNFKFIICRGIAYIYSERLIIPIVLQSNSPLQPPIDDIEKIELHNQDDRFVAAESVGNLPLFFSRIHGVVCVTPSDFDPDFFNSSMNVSGMGEIFTSQAQQTAEMSILSPNATTAGYEYSEQSDSTNYGNLTLYELDPEEIREGNTDPVAQLKAAFIYHLTRNSVMVRNILNGIFKDDQPSEIDGKLDRIVVTIAENMAEDLPAADPRWEADRSDRNGLVSLGSSKSMQIIQQLRDKEFCITKFVEFLHGTGLWSRLLAVTEKGNVRSTSYLLSDINEKIVAAIALKCQHQAHSKIIDEAIASMLNENQFNVKGNLTNQDVFYTKLTRIQEVFGKLAEIIERLVQDEAPNHQLQNAIIEVNTIILQTLQEVAKFREKHAGLYKPLKPEMFEYLPWTAASGAGGLRDTLLQLIQQTLNHGIKLNGEAEYRFSHYQQMTELIDFVLDGRKKYLASIRDNQEKLNVLQHQYESQRFDLIYPLVEDEQYELAAKLAEKYCDFQTLVIICDRTENQQRLDEYNERFKELNFMEFAISWHLKQNKRGNLFERFKNNQAELADFLKNHLSLAWIQLFFNGEMTKASNVLMELAQNETELVARKKVSLINIIRRVFYQTCCLSDNAVTCETLSLCFRSRHESTDRNDKQRIAFDRTSESY